MSVWISKKYKAVRHDAPPPPLPGLVIPHEPFGYATTNGAITGGKGGSTISVTNYDDFFAQLKIPNHTVILAADIPPKNSSNYGVQSDMSNITIVGAPGVRLSVGMWWQLVNNAASNVVIRNITFDDNYPSGVTPKDFISFMLSANISKIYIDHITAYGGASTLDGCIDFANYPSNVTLAHSKFIGEGLATVFFPDEGTLAYNWYLDCFERQPSTGGGKTHVFNNVIERTTPQTVGVYNGYAIGYGNGGLCIAERNVIKNTGGHPFYNHNDFIKGSTTVKAWGNIAKTASNFIINDFNTPASWKNYSQSVEVEANADYDTTPLVMQTADDIYNYVTGVTPGSPGAGATLTLEQALDY